MTLYEINKELEAVIEAAIDPETGEINEEAYAMLDELKLAREEKVENVALFIKNLRSDAEALKKESDNLKARQKSAENKADRLSKYLEFCLKGEKFQNERVAITFRNTESVNVIDMDLIPTEYMRVTVKQEPDKVAIKKALKDGAEIPGAEIVTKLSMTLK